LRDCADDRVFESLGGASRRDSRALQSPPPPPVERFHDKLQASAAPHEGALRRFERHLCSLSIVRPIPGKGTVVRVEIKVEIALRLLDVQQRLLVRGEP
jgi:hypothetical protein